MNKSLFDDLPPETSISLAPAQGCTTLSPAQAAFNKLLQQIEKKRAQITEWQSTISTFQQKYTLDLVPILQAKNKLKVAFVLRLDELYDAKGLSKRERIRLGDMIVQLIGDFLVHDDDPQLEAIFGKYRPRDASPQHTEFDDDMLATMKAEFTEVTGVDLGVDADELSFDEFMQRAQAHLHEQFAAEERARQQRNEQRQAKRKKSAKQLAKEQKEAEDAQDIKLSVREIYRKLVSNLHPDRESDPQQRARKTELMQRVNQAYEKNNLLQLLELQIELDHIDPASLSNLSEERLQRYTKTLKQQLSELNAEKTQLEMEFRARFSIDHDSLGFNARPASIMRLLAQDIAAHQNDLHRMKYELDEIKDAQSVKMWLKTMRYRDPY
ncbi:MAG: J domain-containing protein [Halothiobacillaceae bacterium]|nr:J domain-containing protein [Halothiobacillaceae bacterium]